MGPFHHLSMFSCCLKSFIIVIIKIISHTETILAEIMVVYSFHIHTGPFGRLFSQTATGLNNEAVWGATGQQSLFPCAGGSKGSAPAERALRRQTTAAIIGEEPCKAVQGRPRTA